MSELLKTFEELKEKRIKIETLIAMDKKELEELKTKLKDEFEISDSEDLESLKKSLDEEKAILEIELNKKLEEFKKAYERL